MNIAKLAISNETRKPKFTINIAKLAINNEQKN